jgi:uncharacterized protein (TIGR02147 family)
MCLEIASSTSSARSLEQAERLCSHLQFKDDERRYFLLLLQEERAGTVSLKNFFKEERLRLQNQRLNIKDRIPESTQIRPEDQAVYYSAWYYQAIHAMVSVPKYRDIETIAKALELSTAFVRDAIVFLERTGIVKYANGKWVAGEMHLHLERTSPFIRQHHTNWRLRSIQSLDDPSESQVRYSGVFSLSENDAAMIREKLLLHLKEYIEIVRASPEERVYSLCFDFLEV